MPLARREMQDALVGFRLLRTSAEPSSKTTTSTQLPLVMLSELVVHCPITAGTPSAGRVVGVLLAAALALADLGRLVLGPRGAAAGHPERLQAGERQALQKDQ